MGSVADIGYKRKKIAIVGGGGAGLGALYALRNSQHSITLYEARSRLGGHMNPVDFHNKVNDKCCKVETAFMIMNDETYPNFTVALKDLQIAWHLAPNSMSVSRNNGNLEWSSTSVFAQWINIIRPSFWRMLFDIVRFNITAISLLQSVERDNRMSIGDYLSREGYSPQFGTNYLLPITASIWGIDVDTCRREFPIVTLVQFMWNHKLLNTFNRGLPWAMIEGDSSIYLNTLIKNCPAARIEFNAPVQSVGRDEKGLWLETNSRREYFDNIILATSAVTSRQIMGGNAHQEELDILNCFETVTNRVVLHSDISFMPKRRAAWTAYNYTSNDVGGSGKIMERVSVTCWMNCLQGISETDYGPIFITVNPATQPKAVQGQWYLEHPVYTAASLKGQELLHNIQNKRGIVFAGAWTKYGFHEDAFSSGIQAANLIDPELDTQCLNAVQSEDPQSVWGIGYCLKLILQVIQRALSTWDDTKKT